MIVSFHEMKILCQIQRACAQEVILSLSGMLVQQQNIIAMDDVFVMSRLIKVKVGVIIT